MTDLDTSSNSDSIDPHEAAEPKPAEHEGDSDRLRAEFAEALKQLADERSRADSAEQRVKALQAERDEAIAERDSVRQERDSAREECASANRRADELASQLNESREEREALQLRFEAEASLRETAERERDQTQANLTAEVTAHASTQRALETERRQRAELENQLILLREANTNLDSQLESAKAKIGSLQTRLKVTAGLGVLGTAANLIPRK